MEHPGIILRTRFLEPLGLNANQLATGLGVHRSTVSRLLSGALPLTPPLAAKLGAFFGTPARWFLIMQAEYDAALLDRDADATIGVAPMEPNPDWLLTPNGALWLGPEPEPGQRSAPGEVQTTYLDNGAVLLEAGGP